MTVPPHPVIDTPPVPAVASTSAAVRWPIWAGLVPWVMLWLMELPLLLWNWGFTLSKIGALGSLLPLAIYLALGICVTLPGLLMLFLVRTLRSGAPDDWHRWSFQWNTTIALGIGIGALWLYGALFNNPLDNPTQRWIAMTLGAALGWFISTRLAVVFDRRPVQRLLALLGTTLLLALLVQPARIPVVGGDQSRPNVLLITIDTVNVRHLSTYGYALQTSPNLTRIASEGVLFENAWCHVALTGPSHASLFSGMQPQAYQVYDNAKALPLPVQTLAETFRSAGYYTMGIPGNLVMLEAYNMHQGFDRFPQRTVERGLRALQWEHTWLWRIRRVMWNDRKTSAKMVHNAKYQNRQFLESLSLAGNRRWFTWLHYFDAHAPYTAESDDLLEERELPQRDLSDLGSIDGLFNLSHVALEPLYGQCFLKEHGVRPVVASPAEIRDLVRIYDAQLKHLDEQLGLLFDQLTAAGELENTMIVICGDHGEALYDRGYFGHSYFLHDDEMRVPLIVWYGDKLKPHRVTRPVALSDIAPTILDYAGLPPHADWARTPRLSGKSMRKLLEGQDDPSFDGVYLARYDHSRGVVNERGEKLIFQAVMGKTKGAARPWSGPMWLWFDQAVDPEETTNLAGMDLGQIPEERFQSMLGLQGKLFTMSRNIDGVPTEDLNFQQYLASAVSPEEVEMLKSLGYLQGPSSGVPQSEAECIQQISYTDDAAAYRDATGIDPVPKPMGFLTYLLPPEYQLSSELPATQ